MDDLSGDDMNAHSFCKTITCYFSDWDFWPIKYDRRLKIKQVVSKLFGKTTSDVYKLLKVPPKLEHFPFKFLRWFHLINCS